MVDPGEAGPRTRPSRVQDRADLAPHLTAQAPIRHLALRGVGICDQGGAAVIREVGLGLGGCHIW